MATPLTDLTVDMNLAFTAQAVKALDLGNAIDTPAVNPTFALLFGTGANKANQIWHDRRMLLDGTSETIELSASGISNAFGLVNFANIKGVLIWNRSHLLSTVVRTISSISKTVDGVLTFTAAHGLIAGQNIVLSGIAGGDFTALNGATTVKAVIDATSISIETDTSGYTGEYTENSGTCAPPVSAAALAIGADADPFIGWFGDATDTESLPAGSYTVHGNPSANGWTVDAGKGLKIDNAGSDDAEYDIVIVGEST